MAICDYCEQEMMTADGCTEAPIVIHGHPYEPIRYGRESYRWRLPRCGDCNVAPGQVHHHGCDIEECPACGDQSIGCGCRWAGERDEEFDWQEDTPCCTDPIVLSFIAESGLPHPGPSQTGRIG